MPRGRRARTTGSLRRLRAPPPSSSAPSVGRGRSMVGSLQVHFTVQNHAHSVHSLSLVAPCSTPRHGRLDVDGERNGDDETTVVQTVDRQSSAAAPERPASCLSVGVSQVLQAATFTTKNKTTEKGETVRQRRRNFGRGYSVVVVSL